MFWRLNSVCSTFVGSFLAPNFLYFGVTVTASNFKSYLDRGDRLGLKLPLAGLWWLHGRVGVETGNLRRRKLSLQHQTYTKLQS